MDDQPEPTLVELIRYTNWANTRLLEYCQQLAAEQLAAQAPGSYGTILATLWHMIVAEADYVNRMDRRVPRPPAGWQANPPLEVLRPYADQVALALLEAIHSTPPLQMIHEEEDGNTMDYQARILCMQAVHHASEHRTNITTILSGLGLTLPELDLWGYLFAHPDRFQLKETFRDGPPGGNSQS